MQKAVISATGLFTPEQSISNEELVAAYNAWAEAWNAENAEAIAAGELEMKTPSSEAFIEKASGIKSRFVMDKSGIIDPERMLPHLPARGDGELSILAEMAVKAAQAAIKAWGKRSARSAPSSAPRPTCSAPTPPWPSRCSRPWGLRASPST